MTGLPKSVRQAGAVQHEQQLHPDFDAGGKPLPATQAPFAAAIGVQDAHLRIFETTDMHMHVFPYDYYADRPDDTVGLSRVATLIAHLRGGAANTLLFDNGDFLQGNPMGDFIATERGLRPGGLHPAIAVMNALGYDAATLGNHEFNYGLDFLTAALARANFPVVCANVATTLGASPPQDRHIVEPWVLLDRVVTDGGGRSRPLRIGVIGLTPPQIVTWDKTHLAGRIRTRDIVTTAAALVPDMQRAGAEVIVVLAHSGIGAQTHFEGMENAVLPLSQVPGIDALLTGHTHLVFPHPRFAGVPGVDVARGTIHGVATTMAGFWGSHLGVVDLHLRHDGHRWRVHDACGSVHPVRHPRPDSTAVPPVESGADVLRVAQAAHRATLRYVRRRVGRTEVALHSYFALIAPSPAVAVVAAAQRDHVAAHLRGTRYQDLPVLSAAAPFKAGGLAGPQFYTDVARGKVAIKNIADLYIYPNLVRALHLSGAQLRDWLEHSAGLYNRIAPGRPDQPLLTADFASYNFDMIAGLTYRIDLSQPARFDAAGGLADRQAHRIVDLCHAGRPVDPAAMFVLATNDHRASGGGGFPGCGGDRQIVSGAVFNRDLVVRHIMDHPRPAPEAVPCWGFAPMPGTSVLFDTGPGAAAHLPDLHHLDIELAGPGPGGFLRLRLHL